MKEGSVKPVSGHLLTQHPLCSSSLNFVKEENKDRAQETDHVSKEIFSPRDFLGFVSIMFYKKKKKKNIIVGFK